VSIEAEAAVTHSHGRDRTLAEKTVSDWMQPPMTMARPPGP
jgi:hypothetical protein